jgi:hypothetical protein
LEFALHIRVLHGETTRSERLPNILREYVKGGFVEVLMGPAEVQP